MLNIVKLLESSQYQQLENLEHDGKTMGQLWETNGNNGENMGKTLEQ